MALKQISAEDIRSWNSLDAIADSLTNRGLEEISRSSSRIELEFVNADTACVTAVEDDRSPEISLPIDDLTRKFDLVLVARWDPVQIDIYSKPAAATGLGRSTVVHLGFKRSDVDSEAGATRRLVERLNQIDGYDSSSLSEVFNDEYIIENFAISYQRTVETVVEAVDTDDDVTTQARRHYAQRLVNRFIYLYLLQQAGVAPENYLEQQQGSVSLKNLNVYKEVYKPLFEGVILSDDQTNIQSYVQNFLFEETDSEAASRVRLPKSTYAVNSLFNSILEFVVNWDWKIGSYYDTRHATSVTPRIIGHAIERYINRQYAGAYHTPDPLKHSLVSKALHDSLLVLLNEQTTEEYESLDQLFEATPDKSRQDSHIKAVSCLYREILPTFHVVDPAVGSGSFIQEAQTYLTDIYDECLKHLTADQTDSGTELPKFETANERAQFARQLATHRNLFGVDLREEAIELTRFRLQLSTVEGINEDQPREIYEIENDIELNFHTGNSLLGQTDSYNDQQKSGRITSSEKNNLSDKYLDMVQEYRQTTKSEPINVKDEIKEKASELNNELTATFSEQFAAYLDEERSATQISDQVLPFHWWVGFPDVMTNGGFDAVISNLPWQSLKQIGRETLMRRSSKYPKSGTDSLVKDDVIGINQQRAYIDQTYTLTSSHGLELSGLFTERAMDIAAPTAIISMLLPGSLFKGKSYKLIRQSLIRQKKLQRVIGFENHGIFPNIDGRYEFGLVQFFNSGTTSSFRAKFRQPSLDVLFEDESSFPVMTRDLLESYSSSLLTFPPVETQDDIEAYETIIQHQRLDSVNGWQVAPSRGIHQARESEAILEEPGDYPIYRGRNIYQYAYDEEYYEIDPPENWGVNEATAQVSAKKTIRNREIRALSQREDVDWDGDIISFRDGEMIPVSDIPMPFEEYRIAYRDIARPSDERTMIATVLPPDILCVNTLHTIHPYNWQRPTSSSKATTKSALFRPKYSTKELFCLLGILNSTPFDYLLRSKMGVHLSNYLITESQAPKTPVESELGEDIWMNAARLNCYGERFQSLRDELDIEAVEKVEARAKTQADIDAAVFHAYGFDSPDLVWSILESLPRVRSPRVLDEAYFDMVIGQFEQISGDF